MCKPFYVTEKYVVGNNTSLCIQSGELEEIEHIHPYSAPTPFDTILLTNDLNRVCHIIVPHTV